MSFSNFAVCDHRSMILLDNLPEYFDIEVVRVIMRENNFRDISKNRWIKPPFNERKLSRIEQQLFAILLQQESGMHVFRN